MPPFLGALLSDWAYARTFEIQWTNFASWLILGGLAFGTGALVCAGVAWRRDRRGAHAVGVLLQLATWLLAFFNALVHARDAWATMPTGLVLSIAVAVLAGIAAWWGLSK